MTIEITLVPVLKEKYAKLLEFVKFTSEPASFYRSYCYCPTVKSIIENAKKVLKEVGEKE